MPSSSSARRSPRRAALAAAALGLVATLTGACRVDVKVGIEGNADGTGSVQVAVALDKAAADRIGGAASLRSQLRTADLARAGWRIAGPTTTGTGRTSGGTRVTITHDFRSYEEAVRILGELSGTDGPFRNFRLTRRHSFLKTATSFTGTVDLTAGPAAFGDADVTAKLGGQPLGVDAAELERRLGATLDRLVGVSVSVRLPGAVESNAPGRSDNGATWTPRLGERAVLTATASQWNSGPIALLVGAGTAAFLALALLLLRRRRIDETVTAGNVTHGNDGT